MSHRKTQKTQPVGSLRVLKDSAESLMNYVLQKESYLFHVLDQAVLPESLPEPVIIALEDPQQLEQIMLEQTSAEREAGDTILAAMMQDPKWSEVEQWRSKVGSRALVRIKIERKPKIKRYEFTPVEEAFLSGKKIKWPE